MKSLRYFLKKALEEPAEFGSFVGVVYKVQIQLVYTTFLYLIGKMGKDGRVMHIQSWGGGLIEDRVKILTLELPQI